jgi:hypothetical protein
MTARPTMIPRVARNTPRHAWKTHRGAERMHVLSSTAKDLISRGLPRGNVMILVHAVNLAWCRPIVDPSEVDDAIDRLVAERSSDGKAA